MPVILVELSEFYKNGGAIVSARCIFWQLIFANIDPQRKISMFTLKHSLNHKVRSLPFYRCEYNKELPETYLTSVIALATSSPTRSNVRRFTPYNGVGTRGVEAAYSVARFEKPAFISIAIPFPRIPRYPIWWAGIEFPSKQTELFACMQDFG